MTHLFHRLADRTMRQSRTVRPVTPPLFAPVKTEVESALPTQTHAPQSPVPRRAQRPDTPPHVGETPAARRVAAPAPEPDTPTTPVQTRIVTSPQTTSEPASSVQPTAERSAPVEPMLAYAQKSQPDVQIIRAQTDDTHEPPTPIVVTPPREPLRPAPDPPVKRVAPVNARPRAQRAERSPAPTIEVTIGRIEVRSQAPPPPRRPRPLRQPTLSLEAYAAERKAGRR